MDPCNQEDKLTTMLKMLIEVNERSRSMDGKLQDLARDMWGNGRPGVKADVQALQMKIKAAESRLRQDRATREEEVREKRATRRWLFGLVIAYVGQLIFLIVRSYL